MRLKPTFTEGMIVAGFLAIAIISFEIGVSVATNALIQTYGSLPNIEAECKEAEKIAIEYRDAEQQKVQAYRAVISMGAIMVEECRRKCEN